MASDELRAFAETPDRYTVTSDDVDRYANERVCILEAASWAAVSDVHVGPDDVEALVAEVRARIPSEKRPVWWIGPSCEPTDLHERLQALGFREPADRATTLHAMACTAIPPPAPGIEVRRVESFDDFVVATGIGWDAFHTSEEKRALERPHLQAIFQANRRAGSPVAFLAYVDGEAVGVGRSVYATVGVLLIGGAVVERARGRGVYRALVRARWDDAVARGTPAMITEAMPDSSYPILKRIGFEEVCVVRRLEDPR